MRKRSFNINKVIQDIRNGKLAEDQLELHLCDPKTPIPTKLKIQIEFMQFHSNRTRIINVMPRCIRQINTIGDLVSYSECELLKARNLGRKSVNEIKFTLRRYGLYLGMAPKDQAKLFK